MATFFCPQGGLCGEVNNKIYFIDNINSKLASKHHAITGSDIVYMPYKNGIEFDTTYQTPRFISDW